MSPRCEVCGEEAEDEGALRRHRLEAHEGEVKLLILEHPERKPVERRPARKRRR